MLLAVVAAAVIALAVGEVGAPASAARTSTQLITAQTGVVQSTVTGTGNVEPAVQDTVNFKTAGALQDVFVHVGQHVSEGQLMATLNPAPEQLALDQARENLTAAEDQLASAKTAQAAAAAPTTSTTVNTTPATAPATTPATTSAPVRGTGGAGRSVGAAARPTMVTRAVRRTVVTRLVTITTPSASQQTSSAASVASAQAQVDSAEAAVTSAQQTLDDTRLYAPADGTVISLAADSPGDTISAGSTGSASVSAGGASATGGGAAGGLGNQGGSGSSGASTSTSAGSGFAEIVDSSHLTMTVAFSESDITKIRVGQPATVTLDALAGVELSAHVSAISTLGQTSSSVVSYDATLTIDQNDRRVRPGMSASAAVITDQASGVTLPSDAVSGTGSLATVQLVRNGKSVPTQVVVGLRGDTRTQILSGLTAGQEVRVTTTLPALGQSSASASSGGGTLGIGAGRLGGAGGFGGGGGLGGGFAARLAARLGG